MVVNYFYDNDSRINQLGYAANGSNLGNLTYGYDGDSRIVSRGGYLAALNLPAPTTTANTFGTANQVLTWNGVAATDDAANNVKTDPTTGATYAWNNRDQLSSINSGQYLLYYDALARREDLYSTLAPEISYLYDQYAAVQSGPPGGSPSQSFLMLPSDEVAAVSNTSNGVTTTAVPLHDILGSTIGLVNAAGSAATSYAYEPFGNPTMSGAASAFPYLFAGMEYDASSGLYHTPARYYSPNMGRWLSEDPLQFEANDINLLAYAANDPVKFTDPSGAFLAAAGGYCAYGFAGDASELSAANAAALRAGFRGLDDGVGPRAGVGWGAAAATAAIGDATTAAVAGGTPASTMGGTIAASSPSFKGPGVNSGAVALDQAIFTFHLPDAEDQSPGEDWERAINKKTGKPLKLGSSTERG